MLETYELERLLYASLPGLIRPLRDSAISQFAPLSKLCAAVMWLYCVADYAPQQLLLLTARAQVATIALTL
jgi:hypothetical protein